MDKKVLDVCCGPKGSGSDRIAWEDYVEEFIASETDKEYFDLQEKRYKKHTVNYKLF